MAELALLTPGGTPERVGTVLPAVELLPHRLVVHDLDAAVVLSASPAVILVDATSELARARSTVRTLQTMDLGAPVLAIFAEGGLAVLDEGWPVADVVLSTAGPAEVAARLRLALARTREAPEEVSHGPYRVADVVVDEITWTVRAGGRPLDLTYKEFELLKFLVQHPGRVVTREHLLQEVWGMDYFGGTRTVDVHVRRLRAKLGPERESLISTIRNVGYRFAGGRGETVGDGGSDTGTVGLTGRPPFPGSARGAVASLGTGTPADVRKSG